MQRFHRYYFFLIGSILLLFAIGCGSPTGDGEPLPSPSPSPPVFEAALPPDDATGTYLNTNLILFFNENVTADSGNIEIYNAAGPALLESIAIDSGQVTGSGTRVIEVNPASDLPVSADCYVTIGNTALKNAGDVYYPGITDPAVWNFSTGTVTDSNPPAIVTLTPADDTPNVFVNANLIIELDEPVVMATGNIIIYNVSDDTPFETIGVTDAIITGWGTDTFTIDPVGTFISTSSYYVQIDAGAFKDAANNSFGGISDKVSWNFTVLDIDPPEVSSLTPLDDATNVPCSLDLEIEFNENVAKGTGSIFIYNGADDSVFEEIDVDSLQVTGFGSDTVSINPTAPFVLGSDYYVFIDAGAITDISLNSYPGISDKTGWNFTATNDGTAPGLSGLSPLDDATDVAKDSDLVITFDENVVVATGNITIKRISDNSDFSVIAVDSGQVTGSGTDSLTVNPASDLESLVEYYVNIDAGAITDEVLNPYAGITGNSTWNFTCEDYEAPVINTLSPADNVTDVAKDANILITFDEIVTSDSGNIEICRTADDSVFDSIPVGSATGSGTDTITIDPSSDLESSVGYYVKVPNTAFKDSSDNYFAGISVKTVWNFTCEDYEAPVINTLSPTDNATNVAKDTNLSITFNETVVKGTGNITIYRTLDDTVFETIDVTSGLVTGGGGTTITINPAGELDSSLDFYVQIDSGAFEDQSNNDFTGIADKTTWNFKSIDYIPLYILSAVSMGNTSLQVNCSEQVDQTTANTDTNYTIPGLAVISATRDLTDHTKVLLVTASQSDGQQYYLTVANVTDRGGNVLTDPKTKQFFGIGAGDSTPPRLIYAALIDSNTVLAQFSEPVEQTTAETSGNYAIANNLDAAVAVSGATRQTDISQVYVDISSTFTGGLYTLTVSNVQDASTNVITSPNNVATFIGEGGIPTSLGGGPVIVNPMDEATNSYSILTSYKGRVYIGPADTDDRMFSLKPDGSDPQLITFTFTDSDSTSTNMNAVDAGPDLEDGIDFICGGTVGVTEYLVIGPNDPTDDLNYFYYTQDTPDTGSTLNFNYINVSSALGGGSDGVSTMHVFNGRLYVGIPDSGGNKPYIHKLETIETTPTFTNLEGRNFTRIGTKLLLKNGGNPIGIDFIGSFDGSLYVANGGLNQTDKDGGIVRSTGASAGNPPAWLSNPNSDWLDITPTGDAAWYNSGTRFNKGLSQSAKLVPSDRAFPAMAEFNGKLYIIRNTITDTGALDGWQLWETDSSNAFSLIASRGDTSMGDTENTHATMLIVNDGRLYIGFDNANDGIQIWRTKSLVVNPADTGDFEQVATSGLGYPGNNKKIFNALSISDGGTYYLWILCGDTPGVLSVFRTAN
ncbi:MAG: Ig-like domain-containing protein [Spirochaetales bacterium]|nr:Ig-like domain-containing protein [Spirochaetales bacterium]